MRNLRVSQYVGAVLALIGVSYFSLVALSYTPFTTDDIAWSYWAFFSWVLSPIGIGTFVFGIWLLFRPREPKDLSYFIRRLHPTVPDSPLAAE
jgi:hypothetical protein